MVPGQRLPPWGGSDTLQPAAGAEHGEQEKKQGTHQVGCGIAALLGLQPPSPPTTLTATHFPPTSGPVPSPTL